VAAATVSYYVIERPAQHLQHLTLARPSRALSRSGADERGGQPADDQQADDLRNPVRQP
jgi:hypothetical protein